LSYCVSDKYKDAVAFTKPGEQFLGVNTYIDDKIHAMMDDTDLSQDQVEELLMTHEYMHSAQDIEKFGNNVLIVEADNELKLASYFNDIAQSSDDSQLKERYGQMAEVCLARYSGIISCMQGSDDEHHVEGIELSEISDYCIDS